MNREAELMFKLGLLRVCGRCQGTGFTHSVRKGKHVTQVRPGAEVVAIEPGATLCKDTCQHCGGHGALHHDGRKLA